MALETEAAEGAGLYGWIYIGGGMGIDGLMGWGNGCEWGWGWGWGSGGGHFGDNRQ